MVEESLIDRRALLKGVSGVAAGLALAPFHPREALADGQSPDVVQLPPKVIGFVGPNGGAVNETTIAMLRKYPECGVLVNGKAEDRNTLYQVTETLVESRGEDGRFHRLTRWFTEALHRQPNPCVGNK